MSTPGLPPRLRSIRRLRPMLLGSFFWHLTRWGGLFCCSYVVTKATHDPLLVQVDGALIFAPMLFGFAAGAVSDHFNRRQVVLIAQAALFPVMIMMFAVAEAGAVQVWMVFPFMLLLGVGGLVNMTVQRAWVVDVSGRDLGMRALAMDSAGLALASMAGPVICGAIIDSVGIGAAFGSLAVALGLSIAITVRIPRPTPAPAAAGRPRVRAQLRQSRGLLQGSPALVGMVGVTIVFNFCYFSFTPLVPAMAERFGIDATLTGVLAGAAGAGSVVAGLVLVSRRPAEPGQLYGFGAGLALAFLALFGSAPVFALGLVALALAGCASAGFTAMQSSLAIDAAPDEERGMALGLVSMAIGALPLGMLAMGVTAELVGPRVAVLSFGLGGLTVLVLWLRWRPELLARSDQHKPAIEVDARARVAGL